MSQDYTIRVFSKTGYMFSCVRFHKPLVGERIIGHGKEWKIDHVGELVEETYYDVTVV